MSYKDKALLLAADFGKASTKTELLRLGQKAQMTIWLLVRKIDELESKLQ